MTPNKNDESDRLDYSFIGSQVGYNVNRDIEEQINKIDDLEQVPEEEEVDWWLMLQTHTFSVLFYSNRFNPKHIRLTLISAELFFLF